MQSKRKYGTMKNKDKPKVTPNPVAKALMVSTEVNAKPSVIPNKKTKYNRNKEKQQWKKEI